MPQIDWVTVIGFITVLGFLWNLHRDMADIRERIARLEGSVDMLSKFLIDKERKT